MYNQNQQELAAEVKFQTTEIATTAKLMGLMGFGQQKATGQVCLSDMYDSIVAQATENNMAKASFIPQSLLDLEDKLGKIGMNYIFDSINRGVNSYRNSNCGAMPSAALVASAIGAGALIQLGLDKKQTAGLFDSVRDAMGGEEVQAMYDSVTNAGHSHAAEVPSLAMVTIATIIANGISIVAYLPNPKGTNTVPLVYVRQVANQSYGQTKKEDFLDGIKAANQYFDSVHRFEMETADRKTFTLTTKRTSDENLAPTGDGRLPFILGATSISVGGQFVANDEHRNVSGGATTGEYPILADNNESFLVGDTVIKLTSGKVNLGTDTITVVFDTAIPEGVSVKATVVANYEAKDANGNYILTAPSLDTRNTYGYVTAYPIRAIYTATIDAITQMQNELGVDARAAFVAVVVAKLMLEQNCRLLKQARELAVGAGLQREIDLSRGTDLTQAFNNTAAIGAELIPAVEDMKRRINEASAHTPSGFDIYVTGTLSTVVKSLADDTNFIPTGLTLGSPNSITRIGSRGTDNYYYIPQSADVLEEGEISVVVGQDVSDPLAPVDIVETLTSSDMLIIGRNEVAAKSVFIGHIAVPVITEDVRAKSFEQGLTVYSRQAAQMNRDKRFGRQVGLLRVTNLPKSVTSKLSKLA